jgi:LPS-assembly lipoprotein
MTRLPSFLLGPVMAVAMVLVTGCGFQVRGYDLGLPFSAIAVQSNASVGEEVRQIISTQSSILLVNDPAKAQVVLHVIAESLDRSVVAFSSAGRPREIQLRLRVLYRVTDNLAIELSPQQEIAQSRDISVSESEILAVRSAEDFVVNDMRRDIAQQIVRRLRAVRLPAS